MNKQLQIQNLVNKINNCLLKNQYPNFIEYIRFPGYKNLGQNSKINFSFPLTLFTGLNGSGKSSALHALYGAPEGYSTGQFWFSTNLDPIKNDKENPPAFIYGYKKKDEILEVLKTRVGSSKGADYWEPSRPLKKYGMKLLGGKRNSAIKKTVRYLDFRSELSAFDKYFYFGKFKSSKTLKTRQDVLRKYSFHVKYALDTNTANTIGRRTTKKPVILSDLLINTISKILGKSYDECKFIHHNLYSVDGETIYFKKNNLKYSEAFAGRGEFAVVQLVKEINDAPAGSLILLDEPEVSLHPGAQEELKIFLLQSCLAKKLQIVISTHSPKLVEFMPENAIKLFYENEQTKFSILNNCSYFEAFQKLGADINDKDLKSIIVEDSVAKSIIDAMLIELGGDYPLLFNVIYYPGGAEDMYKASVSYSQEEETHKFIIFDGDKRKPQFNPEEFLGTELKNEEFLVKKLKETTNSDFKKLGFRIDGNASGGNSEQKIKAINQYLKFNNSNIAYFPLNIPEEFIWDEIYANNLLEADKKLMPKNINNYKSKFEKFSELFFSKADKQSILFAHKKFIQNFIKKKDENYQIIRNILNNFHG